MLEEGDLLMLVAWSRRRKAMSPVPPAMSSIFQPWGEEVEVEEVGGVNPGFMERTKWSLGIGLVGGMYIYMYVQRQSRLTKRL